MYKVIISSLAKTEYNKLSRRVKTNVIESLKEIREDPFIGKPLQRDLKGRHSVHVGVYRIIYIINKRSRKVDVLRIRHRYYAYN